MATGAGKDSNILIQGSTVSASRDTSLDAENRVDILAARDTASQRSKSSSSSSSLGVAAIAGQGGIAVGVTVAAGAARGRADGDDVSYTNSHVSGGERVTIKSGGDTNIIGGVVLAKRVEANIGGNLTIESLQDTSKYKSRNDSIGGSATVGAGAGGSVSANRSRADADYAGVNEQSGIQVGDDGFDVKVKGNTDLAGAVIASSQTAVDAGKNGLKTGTLTTRDIENHADASASSQGVSLSSDTLSQGKYGAIKAGLNLLNQANDSRSTRSQTRSAISGGAISIEDDAGQTALTGKNAQDTVASTNRDTANAHVAVERIDYSAMQTQVQADQQIAGAIIAQTAKFGDEAYRRMFVETAKIYVVEKNADGTVKLGTDNKPVTRELTSEEKVNLKAGDDGKVHVANNGIFNAEDSAAKYAGQHSTAGSGDQYFIYFPKADNATSELMIAGYQNFLEGGTLGLTNATVETIRVVEDYGWDGLTLDGHSRGSLTIRNALEAIAERDGTTGSAAGTRVNLFGPAANAEDVDRTLSVLQDRKNMTPDQQRDSVVQLQNHSIDPVGRLIGANPSTGGTIPEGSSTLLEIVRAATGQPITSHNCYGAGDRGCARFWNDSPNSIPSPVPVNTAK